MKFNEVFQYAIFTKLTFFKQAYSLHYWQSAKGGFTLLREDVLEVITKFLVTLSSG